MTVTAPAYELFSVPDVEAELVNLAKMLSQAPLKMATRCHHNSPINSGP